MNENGAAIQEHAFATITFPNLTPFTALLHYYIITAAFGLLSETPFQARAHRVYPECPGQFGRGRRRPVLRAQRL